MTSIEAVYISFVILAIVACVPQIRHLVDQKASTEFRLSSWVVWVASQMATFVYVTSLKAYLLMVVSVAWIGFYTTMASLIIYYRRYPGGRRRMAEAAAPVTET